MDFIAKTQSFVIEIGDWRYNMLLRMEQQRQAGLMLIVDPDARCWFEVGRMECNKQDRELPFKM
jgi:hypothetical protein